MAPPLTPKAAQLRALRERSFEQGLQKTEAYVASLEPETKKATAKRAVARSKTKKKTKRTKT